MLAYLDALANTIALLLAGVLLCMAVPAVFSLARLIRKGAFQMNEKLQAATQWAFDTGHDHALDFIEGNDCQRCAFASEENARQYADFAYGICAELNALPHDDDDPADDVLTCEEGWAAFDDGIGTAIQKSNLPESCPRHGWRS